MTIVEQRSPHTNTRIVFDAAFATMAVLGILALALWISWEIEWAPSQRTFTRLIAAIIIIGFVCLVALFALLVGILQADHYAGRFRSPLIMPSICSAGFLMIYFAIASISAVDVYYEPTKSWPLLRDPGVRIISTVLIFGIVFSKAWMWYELVKGRIGSALAPAEPIASEGCGEL